MPSQRTPSPASVLFSPTELRIYQRWRALYVYDTSDHDDVTPVPDAFEYAAYLEYYEEERSLPRSFIPASDAAPDNGDEAASRDKKVFDKLTLLKADKCKHPLHPAHNKQTIPGSWIEDGEIPDTPSHCPVCTLKLHQELTDALARKWEQLGGPWRKTELGNDARNKYSYTCRAYAKAKVQLVNTMRGFKKDVEEEAAWETASLNRNVDQVKQHGSAKALELYQANIKYPARLAESDELAPVTPS